MQFSVDDVHCDCNETQKWGEVTWRLLMRQQGDPLCERLSLRLVTSWCNFLTSENISSITQIQLSELYTRAVKRKAAASMRRIQTRFTARFHSERTYRNALILIFMLLLICWTVVWFYVLYVFSHVVWTLSCDRLWSFLMYENKLMQIHKQTTTIKKKLFLPLRQLFE